MLAQKNSIAIQGYGNITIQDVDNSSVTINTSDTDEVLNQLKQLNETQLDSLLQIADKQKAQLSDLFQTLLEQVAREKNVVRGGISNVGVAAMGDGNVINYYYHYAAKLPKELTLHIPRINHKDIIGREKDLEDLHELLSMEKEVVVVNGLGGIGKTTLAQAYVNKYYDDYEHVAWITQTSENIATDFLNEGGLVKNFSLETVGLEPEQVLEEIIRKLKGIEERPNLLIIDNAEQGLSKHRDMLPSQPHWHLLVTSREEIESFHLMLLDFLSEEHAIALFKKHYTLQKLNAQEIKELVQAVDYHTLTIEILAKTAKVQRYDASTLKAAIEQDVRANVEVSHNRQRGKIERVGSYLNTVFGLSKLKGNEAWLLKQFACLPADFHSYDLLYELLIGEESPYKDSFSETLSELVQKGWLLHNESTDNWKMHHIIAEVVRKQLPITVTDTRKLIVSVAQKLVIDQTKDNPKDKFVWKPFGKAILNVLKEETSSEIVLLQSNLAIVVKNLGEYKEAKELLEKVVKLTEKNLGKDNPDTATSYSNLALVLRDLGEYREAKVLLEKAVISDEQNFGEDHHETVIRCSNLALVLRDLGEYREAKVLLEKAIKSYEQNFGEDHPYTAASYSNLAMVLRDLGEYQEAKELLEKAVKSYEMNFGEDNPETAIRYSNLALVLRDLVEYQEAKVLLEKAVKSYEQNFGEDHPYTARSYSNLAMVLRDLRECREAKELLEKAVIFYEQNFGEDHLETARSYSNLAMVLRDLWEYQEAKVLLEKAVKSYEMNLGEDHLETAKSYSNLALVLRGLGEYQKALELAVKALNVSKEALPKGHPQIEIAQSVFQSIKNNLQS